MCDAAVTVMGGGGREGGRRGQKEGAKVRGWGEYQEATFQYEKEGKGTGQRA